MRSPDGEHETTETTTETTTEEKPPESLVTGGETKTEETQTETKTEEETTTEETTVEPITVESLTLPEGFELDPELGGQFVEILNNSEMSVEDRANALVKLHTDTLAKAQEADSTAWDKMQTEWKDEAKADPDIGGAKLQPALTSIGKLLDEFGDEKVRGVFDLTGAGNSVHVIRFLNKIAGALTEGGYNSGGPGAASDSPEAKAARLFPTMKG